MDFESIEGAHPLDATEGFATRRVVSRRRGGVRGQPRLAAPQLTPHILADLAINAAVSHRSEFLRFLRGRVRQQADAEDLLQEFYLKVLCKAFQIRDADAIGPWMKSVLRRLVIDYYRARAAESRVAQCLEHSNNNLIGDSTAEIATDSVRVETALHCIRPRYAELVERVDFRGESRASVARSLAISGNNLGVLLHRARKALRDALAGPSKCAPVRRQGSDARSSLTSARPASIAVDGDCAGRWAGGCGE